MWHFKPVVTKSTSGEIGNFRNGNTMLLSLAPFRFCNKTQEFLNSLKLYCTCVHRVPLKADTLEQWSPAPGQELVLVPVLAGTGPPGRGWAAASGGHCCFPDSIPTVRSEAASDSQEQAHGRATGCRKTRWGPPPGPRSAEVCDYFTYITT